MKLTKKPCFSSLLQQIYGDFIVCFEIMYISLLLKMIKGFSWPAKIMASPFNENMSGYGNQLTIIKLTK